MDIGRKQFGAKLGWLSYGELASSGYKLASCEAEICGREYPPRNKHGMNSRYKATGMTGEFNGFLPARLDVKQTADILGFQEHDIAPLVKEELLEPLGKPMPNARKYFARVQIMEIADNPAWLSKATKTIYQHWLGKNASRRNGEDSENGGSTLN